jgi:hypothetical protein
MVQLSELDRTIAELGQHGLAYLGHLGIEIGFVTRAAMQRGDGLHSVAILEKLCPVPTQGGQGRGMRGVVSAGKTTLRRRSRKLSVGKAGSCHCQHSSDPRTIAWLGLELPNAYQVIRRGQVHWDARSTAEPVATGCD